MLTLPKLSKIMSSKNDPKMDENSCALGDSRDPWERPAVRRLATKYAEGTAALHDEGNPTNGVCAQPGEGSHSCKNAL